MDKCCTEIEAWIRTTGRLGQGLLFYTDELDEFKQRIERREEEGHTDIWRNSSLNQTNKPTNKGRIPDQGYCFDCSKINKWNGVAGIV